MASESLVIPPRSQATIPISLEGEHDPKAWFFFEPKPAREKMAIHLGEEEHEEILWATELTTLAVGACIGDSACALPVCNATDRSQTIQKGSVLAICVPLTEGMVLESPIESTESDSSVPPPIPNLDLYDGD
eukprot:Trichotokara_eunicae@DN5481_c1_g1_i1.p1